MPRDICTRLKRYLYSAKCSWIVNKQYPPFGAKICYDICPRTLSVPRGTDNVQGQISELIFAPNGGYRVYYPSDLLRNARSC